jgi:hypothetical protein
VSPVFPVLSKAAYLSLTLMAYVSHRLPLFAPVTVKSLSKVGQLLSEQHDEWQASKRYFSAGSLANLERREEVPKQPQLMAG